MAIDTTKCMGCERDFLQLVVPTHALVRWDDKTHQNITYRACSKECMLETLRKYPEINEARRRDVERRRKAAESELEICTRIEAELAGTVRGCTL